MLILSTYIPAQKVGKHAPVTGALVKAAEAQAGQTRCTRCVQHQLLQGRKAASEAQLISSLLRDTHGFSESVERFTGVPECRVQVGESEERLVVVPLNAAHRSIWATAREARPGLCIVRMPV